MENQITVRLPQDISSKITRKAQQMRLKKSDIVRLAIVYFLGDSQPESQYASQDYDKVSHLLGSVHTGISDLGLNHRKYLIQKLKKNA